MRKIKSFSRLFKMKVFLCRKYPNIPDNVYNLLCSIDDYVDWKISNMKLVDDNDRNFLSWDRILINN